jgi:hypothetical protein
MICALTLKGSLSLNGIKRSLIPAVKRWKRGEMKFWSGMKSRVLLATGSHEAPVVRAVFDRRQEPAWIRQRLQE